MNVPFTHRNYAIAAYLVHGHTPWGHPLFHRDKPDLTDRGDDGWIMCCGHKLARDEVPVWTASGLGVVEQIKGRARLVAGPNIGAWLNDCWDALGGDYQYEEAAA
jgi:hypothetical protein